jgi:hypothetical protein
MKITSDIICVAFAPMQTRSAPEIRIYDKSQTQSVPKIHPCILLGLVADSMGILTTISKVVQNAPIAGASTALQVEQNMIDLFPFYHKEKWPCLFLLN